MNKTYNFDLEQFRALTLKFLTERGDLINVAKDIINNPDGVDDPNAHGIVRLADCAELMADKESSEAKEFQGDLLAMIDNFAIEVVWMALFDHYNSIPEEYSNRFYKLGRSFMIDCCELEPVRDDEGYIIYSERVCVDELTWERLTTAMRRSHVTNAAITNTDVRLFYQELVVAAAKIIYPILPDNPWVTVDFKSRGNTLWITTGEDLRHVMFRQQYGEGRWSGEYVLPNGEAV